MELTSRQIALTGVLDHILERVDADIMFEPNLALDKVRREVTTAAPSIEDTRASQRADLGEDIEPELLRIFRRPERDVKVTRTASGDGITVRVKIWITSHRFILEAPTKRGQRSGCPSDILMCHVRIAS